ncbi:MULTISPECIES: prepilin peptidase [unclassified Brenneria]|uniref:A24 family peptidase n=1 Tax=unclassified Brenneria TaxID=2634434 RepID=UPI0029C20395|nr:MULTISPECIES: prepilin peptidase [unclassified Brenneria]MDX5628494.1 prepilin peptidase [Brenneria sp. L3-3Z]MDX5695632.1 prepilin peptidase [Brenneria sp. L4-2C]
MLFLKLIIIALLIALFGLLIRADLTQRRLPNRWIGYYALLFPVYAWSQEISWIQFALHGLVAVVVFLLLLLPFVRGGIGGGDVKLGVAVMLWAGPQSAAAVLVAIGLVGALLGIAGWLADLLADRKPQVASETPARESLPSFGHILSARRGVPYGVALVAGGITALISQGWGLLP